MSLGKKFFTVGGLTALSRVFGVVREIILSHFLGAGAEMDAYLIAFKFPSFFRKFFAEGGFQSVFVPYYTDFVVGQKLKVAKYFSSRIFTLIFWCMLFFSIVVFIFAKPFVLLMAPGFSSDPEKLSFAIEFTRIIFPSVAFVSLAAVYSSILVSHKDFFCYSLAPILVNIVLIASLLSFTESYSAGYRISFGVLSAAIVQWIFLYFVVKCKGFTVPTLGKMKPSRGIKQFLKKLIPVLSGAGVAQVNIFMDSLFGSFLPTGCITYIYIADRFIQLPLALFGISMATVLLPEIATQFAKGNKNSIRKTGNASVLFALRLTFPAVVFLIVFSYFMISALYGHGKFSNEAVLKTANVLKIFSFGLPAYVLAKVLSAILFAKKDTKTPIMAAIYSILANIILNIILIIPFKEIGVALSTAISGFVNVYVMYRQSKEGFCFNRVICISILKIFIASLILGLFLYFGVILTGFYSLSLSFELVVLSIFCIFGLLLYFAILLLLKDTDVLKAATKIKAFLAK